MLSVAKPNKWLLRPSIRLFKCNSLIWNSQGFWWSWFETSNEGFSVCNWAFQHFRRGLPSRRAKPTVCCYSPKSQREWPWRKWEWGTIGMLGETGAAALYRNCLQGRRDFPVPWVQRFFVFWVFFIYYALTSMKLLAFKDDDKFQ